MIRLMSDYFLPWFKALAIIVPVIWFAVLLARRLASSRDIVVRSVIGILIAFTEVTAVGIILGVGGWLSFAGYLVGLWWPLLLLMLVLRDPCGRWAPADEHSAPWPELSGPLLALTLLSFAMLAGSMAAHLAAPTVEYDELTYHLHFPVQWLNQGRLFLIDTPFGDAAPSYAPVNGELWFAWLMAPFFGWAGPVGTFKLAGVDALARVGQFPFFVLLALSLLLLARDLGAHSRSVYLPAVLLPFVPWFTRQAATASVDLMMAACLMAALALAFGYRHGGPSRMAVLSGLAVGLALGVKYVATVYLLVLSPPLLCCLLSRRSRKTMGMFFLALIVSGAPWYLRNLVVAGNPLFPAQFLFFDGAYTRQAMLASPFRVPNLAAALAVSAQAFGFWLAPVGLGGMIAGLWLAWRRSAWRWFGGVAPVALSWHFLVVPYNSQDRFLLWVVALALLPLAFWPDTRRGRWALLALVPSLLLTVWGPGQGFRVGMLPVAARGIMPHDGVWFAAIVLVLMVAMWFAVRARIARTGVRLAAVFLIGFIPALVAAHPQAGTFVETGLGASRELPFAGYAAVWDQHPTAVAYAGRNAPYYLAGRAGTTRVVYVNTDGQTEMKLHNYVRNLAKAGLLRREQEKADWRGRHRSYESWHSALLREQVELLFLEPLRGQELSYLPHDADGFTIERQWAREHPDQFVPLMAGPDCEIYRVLRP